MDVVDAIAALDRFNFGGALDTLSLQNFTVTDANSAAYTQRQTLHIDLYESINLSV